MTSDIETLAAQLRRDLGEINTGISDHEAAIGKLRERAAGVEGEIRGLERALEMFAPPVTLNGQEAKRHSVQRPVMTFLKAHTDQVHSEETIAAAVNLPLETVHEFLRRAVRRHDIVEEGGLFRVSRGAAA